MKEVKNFYYIDAGNLSPEVVSAKINEVMKRLRPDGVAIANTSPEMAQVIFDQAR
jgi:hypothetical protein